MSEKPTYTIEYDETTQTRDSDGVVEHKHAGFDYWHPVSRKHDGCGRTDGGKEYDVRMCAFCEHADSIPGCHTRRRQLGLRKASVAHGYPRMVTHVGNDYSGNPTRTVDGVVEHKHPGFDYWHPADTWHTASVDRADTLLAVDEAVAELVSAKLMLGRVGKDSEYVQQARFENFTMVIDEIVAGLLKIGKHVYEDMESERKRMEAERDGVL